MRNDRHWLPWVEYVAGSVFALTLLVACIGFVYEGIEEKRDHRLYPPPGSMVDVGGFRMHLYCVGQGSPTVIMDSGLSDSWLVWYKVQSHVAQFTRACSYDRAGLGWSDSSLRPRTSKVIAEELNTLLNKAQVLPPFVLIGHSMGGLNVRMYASLYPADVIGMVLVDSAHPEQRRRLGDAGNPWLRAVRWQKRLMPLGIPRLLGWCGQGMDEMQPAFRTIDCTVKQKSGWLTETDSLDESLKQVSTVGSLGDMPLVVLSHDPEDSQPDFEQRRTFEASWEQMQEELARLSSDGSRIIARGSGHQIHRQRPDLVIDAVRRVVTRCRTARE